MAAQEQVQNEVHILGDMCGLDLWMRQQQQCNAQKEDVRKSPQGAHHHPAVEGFLPNKGR